MTGSLWGGRVLVVGAGTQPSPEPDAPMGNGRAYHDPLRTPVTVVCADRNEATRAHTAELVPRRRRRGRCHRRRRRLGA